MAVAVSCVSSASAAIFQCSPPEKAFNKSLTGTCIDKARFYCDNAGFSIATDVAILLAPMPLVYQLQIPGFQKIALVLALRLEVSWCLDLAFKFTMIDIVANMNDVIYDISSTM